MPDGAIGLMGPGQSTVTAHALAVDDDPSVRQMIADYLGDNDVRVTTLASGREIVMPVTSGATPSHRNSIAAANTGVEAALIGARRNRTMNSVRSR
jgi:CheY-like chemotaxis protein